MPISPTRSTETQELRKPTLYSQIKNSSSSSSVYLLKRSISALVVLNRFSICFYQGLFTRRILHHKSVPQELRKPTLYSQIKNSNSSSRVYLLKRSISALVVLNRFSICFYQGLFTRRILHHRIVFYYYAETNEMIYELVNLKGILYEPKQNSFILSLSPHVHVFQTLARLL